MDEGRYLAQAQFQLNLTGNYLAPVRVGESFNNGLWTPGLTLRYFTNPHLAIGVNARYTTKNSSSELLNRSIFAHDNFTTVSITGQVEYFFTQSAWQPYIGLETGLHKTRFKSEMTGAVNYTALFTYNYFLIGPKLGLQYRIVPSFGVNLAASYQVIPGRNFTDKALLLGGGAFFNFGHR